MLEHGDVRLLQVFLAVVDHGSMSAAAAALHRSTASVSEAVAKLEAKLGYPVLVRTAGGSQPTPAGNELARSTREMLSYVDLTLSTMSDPGGVDQVLRIGSIFGVHNLLVNSISLPGYQPIGVSMGIDDPGREVASGAVDMAILLGPTRFDDRLSRVPLFTEERVAIVYADKLNGSKSMTLEELNEFAWPAIPTGVDRQYLEPWLCYDCRGGPPPKQDPVPPEPFALIDWLQQTPNGVVPTTSSVSSLFLSFNGLFGSALISDTPAWQAELVTRSDSRWPTDEISARLREGAVPEPAK